jgi:hypothetical protein
MPLPAAQAQAPHAHFTPVTCLKDWLLVAGMPGQQAAASLAGEGGGSPEDAIVRFQTHCLQQLPALFSQSGEGVRQMTAS